MVGRASGVGIGPAVGREGGSEQGDHALAASVSSLTSSVPGRGTNLGEGLALGACRRKDHARLK